jgi:hypothetical protein
VELHTADFNVNEHATEIRLFPCQNPCIRDDIRVGGHHSKTQWSEFQHNTTGQITIPAYIRAGFEGSVAECSTAVLQPQPQMVLC